MDVESHVFATLYAKYNILVSGRMNVSLTPGLEQFVNDKLASGPYQNASQVIGEALRLLKERDERLETLRRDVRAGFEAAERGEYEDYDENSTPDLAEGIKQRGRQLLAEVNQKTGVR